MSETETPNFTLTYSDTEMEIITHCLIHVNNPFYRGKCSPSEKLIATMAERLGFSIDARTGRLMQHISALVE